MNKNYFSIIFISVMALVVTMVFSSCSHDDVFSEAGYEQLINKQYSVAFEKAFGKVGPNVDWGFSSRDTHARTFTRAAEGLGYSITFPKDCDPSRFSQPDLTEVLSYEEKLKSLGSAYWTPVEITGYTEVYIDKVQNIKINGGTEQNHAKVYIKKGKYDFTNESFYLGSNVDLYLLSGATLKLNNTAASTAKFDIYIAPEAQLIADGKDGFVADAGAHVYNHGTITCSKFGANTSSILYNAGTLSTKGSVTAESNDTRIVNDGTIECASVTVNAGAVQNNSNWNVSGTTLITSNNSGWVNNGHWTTDNFSYQGGSENVITTCLLEVKKDFEMNINSQVGAFKVDAGGGVKTLNFYGGRCTTIPESTAKSGPFKISMGKEAVFVVENIAQLEAGRGGDDGFGIYGVSSDGYAVFQAKEIVRDKELADKKNHGAVTYGGNLYVSAETHFAQGYDSDGSGSVAGKPFIYEKNGFSIADNIYARGFKTGKPHINIEKTNCNPGFKGGDEPDPVYYRVIAEDLSASEDGDFDFNDVVFDVIRVEGSKTILRLICAGGTLPLRIRGANEKDGVEVHQLFGQKEPNAKGLYNMYNTGTGNSAPVKEFAIEGQYKTPEEIKNIIIEVKKNEVWLPLNATRGEAACKILVDSTFKPVLERHNIADENQLFTAYVKGDFVDKDGFWWKKK